MKDNPLTAEETQDIINSIGQDDKEEVEKNYVEGQVLVEFSGEFKDFEKIMNALGLLRIITTPETAKKSGRAIVKVPKGEEREWIARLKSNKVVLSAYLNGIVKSRVKKM